MRGILCSRPVSRGGGSRSPGTRACRRAVPPSGPCGLPGGFAQSSHQTGCGPADCLGAPRRGLWTRWFPCGHPQPSRQHPDGGQPVVALRGRLRGDRKEQRSRWVKAVTGSLVCAAVFAAPASGHLGLSLVSARSRLSPPAHLVPPRPQRSLWFLSLASTALMLTSHWALHTGAPPECVCVCISVYLCVSCLCASCLCVCVLALVALILVLSYFSNRTDV